MKARQQRPRSPHIHQSYDGPVIDYNGVGIWSADGIRERYETFAIKLNVRHQSHLVPKLHREGERTWIYPLVEELFPLVEAGDPAAIEIGVQLIEEDEFFVFGSLLKMNMAVALRRSSLTQEQQQRLRQRIVRMLLAGNVPREFREYKKLLRKIDLAELWSVLDEGVDRNNEYVMRHYAYLDRYAR
jgi:hypothetical protein